MAQLTYQRIPTPTLAAGFTQAQINYLNEVIRVLEIYYREKKEEVASNSVEERVRTVNASWTLGDDAILLVDTSGGPVTITLPEAGQKKNKIYYVKNKSSSSNDVTLQGPQNIDGSASFTISDLECGKVVSDGTEWWVI